MNKYAQIMYGKVLYVYETHLQKDELSLIFDPSIFWIDVTGIECDVGYVVSFKEGIGIVLTPPPIIEKTLEEEKLAKLEQIKSWTRKAIISGFTSTAKGAEHMYDSTDEDQSTLRTMYIASQSPDFETHPIHQGQVPIRAIPTGKAAKIVLGHNRTEMQKLIDDMALHLGICKQRGWDLQKAVETVTAKEDLDMIVWSE